MATAASLYALHEASNGTPDRINTKMIAVGLMQTPAGDGSSMTAGPSYEYVDSVKARPHESVPTTGGERLQCELVNVFTYASNRLSIFG